jgi:3-deoxy-D-manno-octulosonic-acid transferase
MGCLGMRYVYTLLLYVVLPLILLRLFLKGRKNSAYRERIKERFLWGARASKPVDVWVHAVSLGEVVAAKGLIEQILRANQRVLVTTMTPTGSAQVDRLFGERVIHQYIPYDFPHALRRFFKVYKPRVGIIMETELWPNLMFEAKAHDVALFIANARISDGAFRAYQRVCWFFKPLWGCLTGVFAQSIPDAERFCALGVPKHKVLALGNMKSDLQVSIDVSKSVYFLKQAFGETRPVVIAASTHEGEERDMLLALRQLQKAVPGVVLLIAPRHPERFDDVYALSKQYAFKTSRRTQQSTVNLDTEVVILDSLGELLGFYGLSDYAFVGGSFVPIGGHNVLEPMALRVPVFCGMFMQNSKSLCETLMRAEAMQQVENAGALVDAIRLFHQNPSLCDAQVKRATTALKASQGAVARHVDAMASYWD